MNAPKLRAVRRAIAPSWRSDAERHGLPLVNTTHSGSPQLQVDSVIRASELHVTPEPPRSWWRRWLWSK